MAGHYADGMLVEGVVFLGEEDNLGSLKAGQLKIGRRIRFRSRAPEEEKDFHGREATVTKLPDPECDQKIFRHVTNIMFDDGTEIGARASEIELLP